MPWRESSIFPEFSISISPTDRPHCSCRKCCSLCLEERKEWVSTPALLKKPQCQSYGFTPQNEGNFRASGPWLSQVLHITSTFPSYCYIMRHLRMKQQQFLTLTGCKITLCLKKCWAAKQLLLRTQQVSPKHTHY